MAKLVKRVPSHARPVIFYGFQSSLLLLLWLRAGVRQFTTAAGFSGHTLHASYTDREGNVWFVTENGVDRVRQARLSTVTLPPGFGPALSLAAGDGGAI